MDLVSDLYQADGHLRTEVGDLSGDVVTERGDLGAQWDKLKVEFVPRVAVGTEGPEPSRWGQARCLW